MRSRAVVESRVREIFWAPHQRSKNSERRVPLRAARRDVKSLKNLIFPLVAQLDNAADSDSEERGFESLRAGQKRSNFCLPKVTPFLSKPQAWYIITARSAVHIIKGALRPCISSRASVYIACGLMRYNTAC